MLNLSEHRLGYTRIFCRYIHRNGRIVYPKKAKFFCFWVKNKASLKF